jgi:CubicO group peptidase (beta-lactamase class C family)
MRRTVLPAVAAFLLVSLAIPVRAQAPRPSAITTPPFESFLDQLRQQAGIPGMSAAIVQNGEIVWERGFGFQNQELRARATPDTPYPIADLSETIAATLLLQCVEQRVLDLDMSARRYGLSLPEADATLRNVLSNTSAGNPGDAFRYDPDRFSQLGTAVEFCAPQPYRKSVAHRILDRLAMKDSVPGRDILDPQNTPEGLFDSAALDRYARVLERIAVPYKLDKKGRSVRSDTPMDDRLSASTGVISTVRDLARFDAGLDSTLLLNDETVAMAWSNVMTRDRTTALPMGLGWFVQRYGSDPVIWHFGLIPGAYSSLIIKLPARHLTLVLLANSDGLTAPFQLAQGDVTRSLFAALFLRMFAG